VIGPLYKLLSGLIGNLNTNCDLRMLVRDAAVLSEAKCFQWVKWTHLGYLRLVIVCPRVVFFLGLPRHQRSPIPGRSFGWPMVFLSSAASVRGTVLDRKNVGFTRGHKLPVGNGNLPPISNKFADGLWFMFFWVLPHDTSHYIP
jgi:hypothetical protein